MNYFSYTWKDSTNFFFPIFKAVIILYHIGFNIILILEFWFLKMKFNFNGTKIIFKKEKSINEIFLKKNKFQLYIYLF